MMKIQAVKSSFDASKQLTLKFTVQNKEEEKHLNVFTLIIGVLQIRLKEVIPDNTLLL